MPSPDVPAKAFLSYAEEDERRKEELVGYLQILEDRGWMTIWHFRMIDAGGEWKKEIDEHVEGADIFLLLVTDHFVRSRYCYEKEMGRALERRANKEAAVIPILFTNYLWEDIEPLQSLNWVPNTHESGNKAVESWPHPADALTDVTKKVKKVVCDLDAHLARL